MNRVIRKKTPKMAMLIDGLPIVSSAASASATGSTPAHGGVRATSGVRATGGVRAARVLVVLQPAAHLVGDRIGTPGGVRDVHVGDHERRHELGQAEQEAEVDVAE